MKDYIREAIGDSWETQEVKKTIIFSHNDISGIRYGQWESKAGFSVDEIYNSCDLFINGHLHNQTQINEKMLILGNLTGQNFSEDAFKYSHCAAILDTETLKVELINNPYAFNFYKIDINQQSDYDVFDKLIQPAVVTIKVVEDLVPEIKDIVKNMSKIIVESRILTIPNIKQDTTTQQPIVTVDHIEQFTKYILEHLDNTEILKEELSLL